ncbi:DNA alkylation repair protein [Sulfurimonas aquatica]|uniref:DNA alkylation repair protein n=1 Tax=Sulfurimonas aquatica TaxID=2672570 RepID=A0A975GCU3_9BACT|nr:DNA alkylation repair protein [Sulfurimonas aquatica]QSZ41872.1 DNA alkylation repair protein [Sulfurimonas aquatica]
MAELLKNLYNKEYMTLLANTIETEFISFDSDNFLQSIFFDNWQNLELKQRMRHISTTLGEYLPKDYSKAINILQNVFKKMNNAYALENMIFQDFVEVYGLEKFDISINALGVFTVGSSSEFAIRTFILKYPQEAMEKMLLYAKSDNEHLRRLASEGSRPRLPWAISLPLFKKEPQRVLEILEILKDDESAYVRKSIANNLNDISKDNPELVKEIASSWIGESKNRDMLLKHGCRTLLKQSDRETLELFGYSKPDFINILNFQYSTEVEMGEALNFSFNIVSEKKLGKLRVEYAIYFLRKNQQRNKKVFKISEFDSQEKEKRFLKSYSFKPISTRVYYRGLQKLSIIINGIVFKEVEFTLF